MKLQFNTKKMDLNSIVETMRYSQEMINGFNSKYEDYTNEAPYTLNWNQKMTDSSITIYITPNVKNTEFAEVAEDTVKMISSKMRDTFKQCGYPVKLFT